LGSDSLCSPLIITGKKEREEGGGDQLDLSQQQQLIILNIYRGGRKEGKGERTAASLLQFLFSISR